MSTCQICARSIKANTGLIAHHGYERPGGGWQTKSCMGARYLPYEQSCDRIPVAIESVQNFIADRLETIERFKQNPPNELSIMRGYDPRNIVKVPKPDNFDPQSTRYTPHSYAAEYHRRIDGFEKDIRSANIQLTYLQERLAAWVAPEKEAA